MKNFIGILSLATLISCGGSSRDIATDTASCSLVLDASGTFEGSYSISGFLASSTISQESRASILINGSNLTGISETSRGLVESNLLVATGCAGTLTYTITGLRNGSYSIGVAIDINADGITSAGDYEGWYGGSPEVPITTNTSPQIQHYEISGANGSGVNIPLGFVH